MKFILIFFLLYPSWLLCQSSIYKLQIQKADGESVSLSSFKGKKILIACISQEKLQKKGSIQFLDSLKKSNPSIEFLIIPANDFGEAEDAVVRDSIANAIPAGLILSSAAQVKKNKGDKQSIIVRWLTNATENSHFDADVETDEQIYVISESGVLYAVLEKGVSSDVLNEVLKQPDIRK